MKVEGEAPEPDTVAVPCDAAVRTDQVNELDAVSLSEADTVGGSQEPELSSVIVSVKGPFPCAITGGSLELTVMVTVLALAASKLPSLAL